MITFYPRFVDYITRNSVSIGKSSNHTIFSLHNILDGFIRKRSNWQGNHTVFVHTSSEHHASTILLISASSTPTSVDQFRMKGGGGFN